ncbi:MAG TPA: heme-binding protein [Dehalococcoidia bacterium]|nr:heme-binding protein [Dehalococcoidia bacterium]
MKSETGRRMMDAARAKAAEIGKGVSIAIVDTGGTLVVLERVNDPPPATALVAEGKAVCSVMFGRDSGVIAGFADRIPAVTNSLMARLNGRFVALQGAVVVQADGETVGAVGVSGATSEEDEAIAGAARDVYGA